MGCFSVVLFDNDEAACVIQDTKISIVPFNLVSEEHAYKEGENDRTLENWREVHKRAFTPDYEEAGLTFDEQGDCVLEEFKVVFREIRIQKKERIQTERLILKPYKASDRDRLVEFFTNEEIAKTFMIPEYQASVQYYELADKVIAFSQTENKTHLEYGIYLGEILIGTVNDCGFDDETIEIGYLIHPDYKGNGYATEVLNTIISEVREMGFKKVIAGFFEENIASKRVLEKCGMHLNDTIEEEEYRSKIHRCFYCELDIRS